MTSFSDFVAISPFNSVVATSKTAKDLYENVIWREDVRIKFVDNSVAGLAALDACAEEIEQLCSLPSSDLDLTNPTVKQTIGRMVSVSIEPFGFTSRMGRKARMPQGKNYRYFKYAHVFDYVGGETQRVERRIVDV